MTNLAWRDHVSQPTMIRTNSGRVFTGTDIRLVEDSGRVIVGDLHREVRVIKSSGRRFSNGLLVNGEKVWARQ